MKKFDDVWDEVAEVLPNAQGIAWDTCHKIYVLMDSKQMELMGEYGYDPLIFADDTNPAEMLETLKSWFNDSCSLRFIHGVETNEEDPNAGFTNLIPQGYEAEFCVVCGNFGADYDQLCEDCRDDESTEDEDEEDEEE